MKTLLKPRPEEEIVHQPNPFKPESVSGLPRKWFRTTLESKTRVRGVRCVAEGGKSGVGSDFNTTRLAAFFEPRGWKVSPVSEFESFGRLQKLRKFPGLQLSRYCRVATGRSSGRRARLAAPAADWQAGPSGAARAGGGSGASAVTTSASLLGVSSMTVPTGLRAGAPFGTGFRSSSSWQEPQVTQVGADQYRPLMPRATGASSSWHSVAPLTMSLSFQLTRLRLQA